MNLNELEQLESEREKKLNQQWWEILEELCTYNVRIVSSGNEGNIIKANNTYTIRTSKNSSKVLLNNKNRGLFFSLGGVSL